MVIESEIDIPGSKNLIAVSVHLKTKPRSQAHKQVVQLIQYLKRAYDLSKYYLVIGGDFNSPKINDPALNALKQLVDTSKPAKDRNNNMGTNASRKKPYDLVLAGPELTKLEVTLILGTQRYEHGVVFDSRVFTPLSEVRPVRHDDSKAKNMQHMAVMKRFKIPSENK